MGIDRRYSRALSSLIMSFILVFVISLSLTLIRHGAEPGFLRAWLSTAGIALPIAVGVSFLAGPAVQRTVAWMTQPVDGD